MSEVIKLYGGPKHGETRAVPENFGDVLVIEVADFTKTPPMRREARYTRVTMRGRRSNDFEWSGFKGPSQPIFAPE